MSAAQEGEPPIPGAPDGTDCTTIEASILSKPANRSTPARMRTRLETYAQTGRVNRACEAAHIEKNALQKAGSRSGQSPNVRTSGTANRPDARGCGRGAGVERALNEDTHLLLVLLKRFRPEA